MCCMEFIRTTSRCLQHNSLPFSPFPAIMSVSKVVNADWKVEHTSFSVRFYFLSVYFSRQNLLSDLHSPLWKLNPKVNQYTQSSVFVSVTGKGRLKLHQRRGYTSWTWSISDHLQCDIAWFIAGSKKSESMIKIALFAESYNLLFK